MKKTYTKATEFTTIINEQLSDRNFEVFTWFSDAEESFATDPKHFTNKVDADNEVSRLLNKFANL